MSWDALRVVAVDLTGLWPAESGTDADRSMGEEGRYPLNSD